jgi:hypothetical protein
MVEVEANGARPKLEGHGAVAVVLSKAVVDAAGEESGEENEAFSGGDEAERLIHVRGGDGGKVRAGDPDEHEAAEGVELESATAGRLHLCLIRGDGRGFLDGEVFVCVKD